MAGQHIMLTTDTLVFSRDGESLQLLVVERKSEPYKGMWALPGGFIDYNEDPEAAAIRELHEETGIKLTSVRQLHTFGKPGRDPRGHTVSIAHYAFVHSKDHPVKAGDDAAAARWIEVKDIDVLAFDHVEMLEMAMDALNLGPYRHRHRID